MTNYSRGIATGICKLNSSNMLFSEFNKEPDFQNSQMDEIYSNQGILEQLVYVETFMPELDNNVNQNNDLKLFADSSFIFTDEEKPKNTGDDKSNIPVTPFDNNMFDGSNLGVPPGAKNSFNRTGLSDNQISMLSELINTYKGQERSYSLPSSVQSSSRSNSIVKIEDDIDKRKRNTAASARFRIKKKLKEQKLEDDVKNLKELASQLEERVKSLSMENKVLKNLIVEKNERKSREDVERMKKRAVQNFSVNKN